MKKLKIEDILHSKGYVSIETLIVAGLILAGGAFLISKFILSGKKIGDKSNNSITNSKTILDNTDFNKGSAGTTTPTTPSKDSKFFTYKDVTGGIEITGYSDDAPKDVVIPSEIDGKKVVSLKQGAFYNKGLNSVVIPNTVTRIGDETSNYATFQGNNLTEVKIPDSVTSIGAFAFRDNQLTSVTIPDSVTSIGVSAFYSNKLTSITIPNSVKEIGDWAFWGNKLTSITIPDSVTSIGAFAFTDNNISGSVTIPNSVTSLSSNIFDNSVQLNCTLKDFYYKDVTGGVALVGYYGKDKDVTIPSEVNGKKVVEIGNGVFWSKNLTSVVIPDTVKEIGQRAFNSNKLTSITIPNSVTNIKYNAFSNNQLEKVTLSNNTKIDNTSFDSNVTITRK